VNFATKFFTKEGLKMFKSGNWHTIKSIVDVAVFVLQYALFPVFLYHFVISIFGWVKRKEVDAAMYAPKNRFALLVAAHNEELVIGNIVRSLKSLDYPAELYDIYVIADNCNDSTARIARESGAIVFERFDSKKRGKGFALQWMFRKLFALGKCYDAVCVFDADNLVSPVFLKEMNKQLCRGYEVVQGYLDSKNPYDSLISSCYSITYWLNNRLFQLPRYYLGLSCAIGGTGFTVSTRVLKEIGWDATCLTEDLEFTIKLVLAGKKVYWAHNAVVYDEKPITLAQSWKQRKRWMQGQADCACRYMKKLLAKFMRDKDMVAFDCAIYLIQPLIIVVSGFGVIANFLRLILFTDISQIISINGFVSSLSLIVTTYIGIIFVFMEGRVNIKVIWYYILFPFYNFTWIPIIIQGFIDKDQKEWSHTLHTRSIDLADMKN